MCINLSPQRRGEKERRQYFFKAKTTSENNEK